MTLNKSGSWEGSMENSSSSSPCAHNMTGWEQNMDRLYTYFYLLLFIPGLFLNAVALWVLCRHISKKSKAVIFMINLAAADLAHILSLPLRIYYYFTHTWPFGHAVCLFCFYLKYLNMYASIAFLVCISMQRCVFLLHPFAARRWRRRYDLLISILVWVVVGLACSPFILMRNSSSSTQNTIKLNAPPLYTNHTLRPASAPSPAKVGCFKDLPTRRLPLSLAVTMMVLGELFGFLLPLAAVSYSSIRIARSLNQSHAHHQQNDQSHAHHQQNDQSHAHHQQNDQSHAHHQQSALLPLGLSARQRLHSVLSSCQTDKTSEKQADAEKRRALLMVLSCSVLFLVCFAPYHINFLLYLMVSQDIVSHCATRLAVRQFHPVSLCLASLSCCLNPLLYYFLTAEFRSHLSRRTSSFTSSLLSSSLSPPSRRPAQLRVTSMESSCSDRDWQSP